MDIFWLEASPWNGATGQGVTVRATSADLSLAVFYGGGAESLPILAGGPVFSTTVFTGAFTGRADSSRGQLQVIPGVDEIDPWANLAWSSRPAKIWMATINADDPVAPSIGNRTLLFDGIVESFDPDEAMVSLATTRPNGVVSGWLYSGNGGIDGDLGLAGMRRPMSLGYHRNRPPVLLNAGKLIFQCNGAGALEELVAVRERGVVLDQIRVQHATFDALFNATVPATEIHYHLGSGTFRLGFTPAGDITADFRGKLIGRAYPANPAALAMSLLISAGWDESKIDAASFGVIAAAFPHEVQYHDDGGQDIADALTQLMLGCAGYWDVDLLGVLYVGIVQDAPADFSIGDEGVANFDILELDLLPTRAPFWKNRLSYALNPSRMTFSDTEAGITREQMTLIENAIDAVDGKIDISFQPGEPTSANQHDLWYDTDDQLWYRFEVGTGWVLTRDAGVGKAIADAAGAAAAVDGKITSYSSVAQPDKPNLGDIWVNPNEIPRTVRRWNGTIWDAVSTVGADVNTNVIDTGAGGGPAVVPRGNLLTDLGTSAGFSGQGQLATQDNVTAGYVGFQSGGGNLVRNSSGEGPKWSFVTSTLPGGFWPYNNDGDAVPTVWTVLNRAGLGGGNAISIRFTQGGSWWRGVYFGNNSGVNNEGMFLPLRTYMVSVWARGTGGAIGSKMNLAWNVQPLVKETVEAPLMTDQWQRYVYRVKWGSAADQNGFWYCEGTTGETYLELDQFQVELGDVATAWKAAFLPGEVGFSYLNNTAVRLGSNIVRADGFTSATESLLVTTLGIASGFAGQGGLASLSYIKLGIPTAGFANLIDEDNSYYVTNAKAITSLGIASGFTGQGWGATASQDAAGNDRVATGMNLVVDSQFTRDLAMFAYEGPAPLDIFAVNLPGWWGRRRVAFMHAPSMAKGQYMDFSPKGMWGGGKSLDLMRKYCVPVAMGDRCAVRSLAAPHRCGASLHMLVFNRDGGLIYSPAVEYVANTHGSDNGENMQTREMIWTCDIPSAAYFCMMVRSHAFEQAWDDPYLFISEPWQGKLAKDQTVLPPYSPGPADWQSDKTGDNVASGFTGQSAWATLTTSINRISKLTDGGLLTANNVFVDGVAFLSDRFPAEGGANVTGNHVSSGFSGQTAMATAPYLDRNNIRTYFGLSAFSLDYTVTRSDGVTTLTEAVSITSLGIASGFSGQGQLATLNDVPGDKVVGGTIRNADGTSSWALTTAQSRLTRIKDGTRRVQGTGFGASGDLMEWIGPHSVAEGQETRTNGYWAQATDGKSFYGSAELGSSGGSGGVKKRESKGIGLLAGDTNWVTVAAMVVNNVPQNPFVDLNLELYAQASDPSRVWAGEFKVLLQDARGTVEFIGPTGASWQPSAENFIPGDAGVSKPSDRYGQVTVLLQMRRTGAQSQGLNGGVTFNYTALPQG